MTKWTTINIISCEEVTNQMFELSNMLNEMLTYRIDNCNTILCLSIPVSFLPHIDIGRGSNSKTDSTTVFYKVTANGDGRAGKENTLEFIDEYPLFDVKNKTDIEKFFAYVADEYPSEKYMLFTWGHGAAYGLFFPGGRLPGGKLFDMLVIKELKEVILNTFGKKGRKINIVIMMNCYMQFYDTGLELRDAGVDYLVASVCGADFSGYNYDRIYKSIYTDGAHTDEQMLAELAVNSLNDLDSVTAAHYQLEDSVYYATKLSNYIELETKIDQLSDYLLTIFDAQQKNISSARRSSFVMHSGYFLVDLVRFLNTLQSYISDAVLESYCRSIQGSLASTVVAGYQGQSIRGESYCPLGFSVCIPDVKGNLFFETFMKQGAPIASVSSKSKWGQFVSQFVSVVAYKMIRPISNVPSEF